MRADDLVLVSGMRSTRATLREWNDDGGKVLGAWVLGALAVSVVLLVAIWLVATLVTPDPDFYQLPDADLGSVGIVLFRNGLVLSLHALACVAGFIAGASLPLEAERYSGWWRTVHDHAGRIAIAFVGCATLFSLSTQAWILGGITSSRAADEGLSPAVLLIGLLPHALPELVALFLPLAAWLLASRRGAWHELLAATFVTVAIAVPTLVAAAFVEVYVSPHLIGWLAG
jgi:Stage II sporulation protein M